MRKVTSNKDFNPESDGDLKMEMVDKSVSDGLEINLSIYQQNFYSEDGKGKEWIDKIKSIDINTNIILVVRGKKEDDYIHDIQDFLNFVHPDLRRQICIVDATKDHCFHGKFNDSMYFHYRYRDVSDLFRRMYHRYSLYNFEFPEKWV